MLNYKSISQGIAQIIFIHGNSQSLAYWDNITNSELGNEYQLITVDLPGHGNSLRSSKPNKDYTLMGMAEHLLYFIKKMPLNDYILVGNSLGCNIIGECADKLLNCKGIILTGPSIVGKNLEATDILKPNPNLVPYYSENSTDEQINLLINDTIYIDSLQNKELIKKAFINTDPKVRIELAKAISNKEYSDELNNIEKNNIPTAVVFGEYDKLCITDYLDKVNFKIWNDKTQLIQNSGHFITYDNPKQLIEFIAKFAENCLKR